MTGVEAYSERTKVGRQYGRVESGNERAHLTRWRVRSTLVGEYLRTLLHAHPHYAEGSLHEQ